MKREDKLEQLKQYIRKLDRVAIAFSGGVDSTFLLKIAHQVLGEQVIAVTAVSELSPGWEAEQARYLARLIGSSQLEIRGDELNIQEFSRNGADRCYYCKQYRFSRILEIARGKGISYVADGSNYDDLQDFRPGRKAARELGILSPLEETGMTKAEVRFFSKEMGLPTWDQPSFACLASRIPYGQEITREKLKRVEVAEDFLRELGFKQLRVRVHGEIARIEVAAEEREKFFSTDLLDRISNRLKAIGFVYVTLELGGYRTGSMNQVLIMGGDLNGY